MHARNRHRHAALAAVAALSLVAAACGSKSTTTSSQGSTSDTNPTNPGDGTGPSNGSGTGPCVTRTQQACQECVDAAAKVCNESLCKSEDLDLQNCSVMAVWAGYTCESPTGVPTDCCKIEEQVLINCWQKCPEMQACS